MSQLFKKAFLFSVLNLLMFRRILMFEWRLIWKAFLVCSGPESYLFYSGSFAASYSKRRFYPILLVWDFRIILLVWDFSIILLVWDFRRSYFRIQPHFIKRLFEIFFPSRLWKAKFCSEAFVIPFRLKVWLLRITAGKRNSGISES